MSRFTLYRADVDSPRLARVLGKVPGVAVDGEQEAEETPDEPGEDATPEEREDSGGLRAAVPIPDTDVVGGDEKSVVKSYGLLGLGVSMVTLGVATVGVWVYLRRKNGDSEAETPPPATGLDTGEKTPPAATPAPATDETVSIVQSDEQSGEEVTDERAEETPERGRTEGDRTDVEWTTRETTPAATDESEDGRPDAAESDDEREPRPTESVDAAPLLGAAFLAVSGAVVKWLQSGDET